MADKRKLQSDIDRNLKRVQEGRTAFQETLDKYESSTNQTQKEKIEADLKKEIKKLQRLRDQIKTWLTSSEIKDKRGLLEARKFIEQDMERFKIIEKETKTKAYSKEGLLSSEAKKDPITKEKEELDEWLRHSIALLNSHTEKYEFDIESLSTSGKKKRMDKDKAAAIEDKKQRLEICLFHIEKLETTLRHFDNERICCEKVKQIKGGVEYVIESIDDPGIVDDKSLYDDLCLDELGDGQIVAGSTTLQALQDGDLLNSSAGSRLVGGDTTEFPNDISSCCKYTDDGKFDFHITAPLHSSSTSTPVKPSSNGSTNSKASCKSGKDIANQTAPANLLNTSGTSNKTKGHVESTTVATSKSSVDSKSNKDNSRSSHSADGKTSKSTKNPKDEASGNTSSPTADEKEADTQAISVNTSVGGPFEAVDLNKSIESSQVNSLEGQNKSNQSSKQQPGNQQTSGQQRTSMSGQSTTHNHSSVSPGSANVSEAPGSTQMHPKDAAAPFRNKLLDKSRVTSFPLELQSQMQSLESAYMRLPNPVDTERSRMIVCKNLSATPVYYPKEPLKQTDTEEYFMKLDAQTLFFIFYHFEGTKAQFLAAKSLKRMSWRFHTKLMMWFQRHEEPKQITEEYESGAYIYYDYKTMTQRKRDEFTFHYSFLEDKDF